MAKQSQPNTEMGARAKARREVLGIKKNELALKLDIGSGRLSQMELDGVDGVALARRWAAALHMDVQDLVFGFPHDTQEPSVEKLRDINASRPSSGTRLSATKKKVAKR